MYKKKIVFSAATVPALGKFIQTFKHCSIVLINQLAEYQNRQKDDKQAEGSRRAKSLGEAPVDITPQNKSRFLWSDAKNLDQFEQEWSFKPVTLKGIFDHQKEIQVNKQYRGEKGVQIITPFYTHLDGQGKACAILVNRGWVP